MADQGPSPTSDEHVVSEEEFLGLNALVEKGDTEALERFIKYRNITPDSYYRYFRTHRVFNLCCAVGLAAKCGQLDVMKMLLSLEFNVNEKSFHWDYVRPIHLACAAGHVAVVKSLVEDYGVDVGHRDNCSTKPALCRAASNGRLSVIQYFLESGTDVNSKKGMYSLSMLHSAAEDGQSGVCEYLLSKGAVVDICNDYKVTPLILAARCGFDVTTRVLLDAGADVNSMDKKLETPFLNAAENGHISTMKLLVSRGANPGQYDRFNFSALYYAVKQNRYDIVQYLVIELNTFLGSHQDCGYKTPFGTALAMSCFDIVDLFVRAGYNPAEEVEEFYEDSDGDKVEADVKLESKQAMFDSKDTGTELQKKLRELKHIVRNPRSLKALSVYAIRRVLNRRLSKDVDRLPVCEPLKKIVMYCDVIV